MDTKTKAADAREAKPLIIANPIYDTVFKRLMEDSRIVKFFLSTILGQPVTAVNVLPQEFTYKKEDSKQEQKNTEQEKGKKVFLYSIYRIDFMATVLTEDGTYRKVLIEIQKSLGSVDVNRFRKYLGRQYSKKNSVIVDNKNEDRVLPITTIYILGSKLSEIKCSCLKVGRTYTDMVTEETVHERSGVVEKLTHDSYFIQVGRITDNRYATRLDKLLSIFEQTYFVEADSEVVKEYRYQPDPDDEEIKMITNLLHEMGADPEERKRIKIEEEAMRTVHAMFIADLEKKDKIIEEKEKKLEEDKKIIEEKDKKLEEKDKKLEKKDKEMQALKEKLAEMERLSRDK
jgi:hypothetical protein